MTQLIRVFALGLMMLSIPALAQTPEEAITPPSDGAPAADQSMSAPVPEPEAPAPKKHVKKKKKKNKKHAAKKHGKKKKKRAMSAAE